MVELAGNMLARVSGKAGCRETFRQRYSAAKPPEVGSVQEAAGAWWAAGPCHASLREAGQKTPPSCRVSSASLLTKLNVVPAAKGKLIEGYKPIFEEQAMISLELSGNTLVTGIHCKRERRDAGNIKPNGIF